MIRRFFIISLIIYVSGCFEAKIFAQDNLMKYDSLHKEVLVEKLLANSHYYDDVQIKLVPKKVSEHYVYNFYADKPTIISVDTTYLRENAKYKSIDKLKKKDVRIDTLYTLAYKHCLIPTDSGEKYGTLSSDIDNVFFTILSSFGFDNKNWLSVCDKDGNVMQFCIEDVSSSYIVEIPAYYEKLAPYLSYVGKSFYVQDLYIEGENTTPTTYTAARYSRALQKRIPESSSQAFCGAIGQLNCVDIVYVDGCPCLVLECESNTGFKPIILAFDKIYLDPTSKELYYNKKDNRLLMIKDLIPSLEWESQQFDYNLAYRKEREAEEEAKKIALKEEYMQKYGEKYGQLIFNKQVVVGMTKKMCRESWGDPIDINRTVFAWGTFEQWVYDIDKYLYFEDGILKTIQY